MGRQTDASRALDRIRPSGAARARRGGGRGGAAARPRGVDRRRRPVRQGLARPVLDRRQRLSNRAARGGRATLARRHRSRRAALPQASLSTHHARRRDLTGGSGDRRRHPDRHLEVLQPDSRAERRGALGAGRAGHRARRAQRGAAAARLALRPGHLHRQPRHDRRHDGEQLERRALGPLRQDHRSRARSASGALGRLARACAPPDAVPNSRRAARARRSRRSATAPSGRSRADCADEVERRFPKILRRVGGYNLDAFVDPGAAVRPDAADGRLRRHARRRPRRQGPTGAAATRQGGARRSSSRTCSKRSKRRRRFSSTDRRPSK